MGNAKQRTSRLPPWLRVRAPTGETYHWIEHLMRSSRLHTVCEEAHCPNSGECWNNRTATLLILGDTCTRNCRFCNVRTGRPAPPDPGEPRRVAQAVQAIGLRHVVITSVDRDDLPDGGASVFAATIRQVREAQPGCTVEVLTSPEALETVVDERPDVLGHNVETVERLFRAVQPQCRYDRSIGQPSSSTRWPACTRRTAVAPKITGTEGVLEAGFGVAEKATVAPTMAGKEGR